MKKILFVVIAAAAMMSACTKVELETRPEGQILNVEVVDSGVDQVSVSENFSGTAVSFRSWMELDVERWTNLSVPSRTTKRENVSVDLKTDFAGVTQTLEVKSFDFHKAVPEISYRQEGQKQQSTTVSVIDSVMVCKLDYGAFAVELENSFQVSVYMFRPNKLLVMPYQSIQNVTLGEATLGEAETVVIKGTEYQQRIFRQPMEAVCDGNPCKADICLTLLRPSGL